MTIVSNLWRSSRARRNVKVNQNNIESDIDMTKGCMKDILGTI